MWQTALPLIIAIVVHFLGTETFTHLNPKIVAKSGKLRFFYKIFQCGMFLLEAIACLILGVLFLDPESLWTMAPLAFFFVCVFCALLMGIDAYMAWQSWRHGEVIVVD